MQSLSKLVHRYSWKTVRKTNNKGWLTTNFTWLIAWMSPESFVWIGNSLVTVEAFANRNCIRLTPLKDKDRRKKNFNNPLKSKPWTEFIKDWLVACVIASPQWGRWASTIKRRKIITFPLCCYQLLLKYFSLSSSYFFHFASQILPFFLLCLVQFSIQQPQKLILCSVFHPFSLLFQVAWTYILLCSLVMQGIYCHFQHPGLHFPVVPWCKLHNFYPYLLVNCLLTIYSSK